MLFETIVRWALSFATLLWVAGFIIQLLLYGTVTEPCCQ